MHSARGFTLIELLIVITIIGILTILTIVNFKDFAQNQQLIKAIGEIQTILKLAQSNATSSVLCNGNGGVKWIISFENNKKDIKLWCGDALTLIQTLSLQNIEFTITPATCVKISYSALLGIQSILDSNNQNCLGSSDQALKIILRNLTTGNTKSFKMSLGGAIDVQ